MKYKIVYDSPGRLRLRCGGGTFSKNQESSLAGRLCDIGGVCSAEVSAVNGGILLCYTGDIKETLLKTVADIKVYDLAEQPLSSTQIIDEEFKKDFISIIRKRIIMKLFVPKFISVPLTVLRAVPFVKNGFNSGLILLGIAGVISPVSSALLHNLSTMGICLNSMKPFLSNPKEEENAVLD